MIKPKEQLKEPFTPGNRPSSQDYENIIDSIVHVQTVPMLGLMHTNQAITNYDRELRSLAPSGKVDTMGKVFQVLDGFVEGDNLESRINDIEQKAKWDNLPEKPVSLPVTFGGIGLSNDLQFNISQQGQSQTAWIIADNPVFANGNAQAPFKVLSDLFVQRRKYTLWSGVEITVDNFKQVRFASEGAVKIAQ